MLVGQVIRQSWDQFPLGLANYVEIDGEIFSMIILLLLLIQEGQLSFSGEVLVNCFNSGLSLPSKNVVR